MGAELRLTLRASRVFGALEILSALLVAYGVFGALPARYWLVDAGAVLVASALALSGVGLLARATWSETVARIAGFITLGLGLLLVATLAITASYLRGIYGPVGRGGAIILALVAALALPYLVVLPATLLAFLGPRARS